MNFPDLSVRTTQPSLINYPVHNKEIRLDRLLEILSGLSPLTHLYYDSEGRSIQLYKTKKYGLIGTVSGQNQQLTIIPGKNTQRESLVFAQSPVNNTKVFK